MISPEDFKKLIDLSLKDSSGTEFLISTARLSLSETEFFELFKGAVAGSKAGPRKDENLNLVMLFFSAAASDREAILWCKQIDYAMTHIPKDYKEVAIDSLPQENIMDFWLGGCYVTKSSLDIKQKEEVFSSPLTVDELMYLRSVNDRSGGQELALSVNQVGGLIFGLSRSFKKYKSEKCKKEVLHLINGHCKDVLERAIDGSFTPSGASWLGVRLGSPLNIESSSDAESYMELLVATMDAAKDGLLWRNHWLFENVFKYCSNDKMEEKWYKAIEKRSDLSSENKKAFLKFKKKLDSGNVLVGSWFQRHKLVLVANSVGVKSSHAQKNAL